MFVHQLCDWLCLAAALPAAQKISETFFRKLNHNFCHIQKKCLEKQYLTRFFFCFRVLHNTTSGGVASPACAKNHPGPAPNRWLAKSGLQLLISPLAANWVTRLLLPAAPYELTLWGHWKWLGSSQEVRLEELSGPARGERSSAGILTEPAAAVKDKELYL